VCLYCRQRGRHHLDTEPLRLLFELAKARGQLERSAQAYGRRFGITRRRAWSQIRAIRNRPVICAAIADQWCVLFGLHPVQVFGITWERRRNGVGAP
jgi:hypothetical protein